MIQLKFYCSQELVDIANINVLVMLDMQEQRQLVIITDRLSALHVTVMFESSKDPIARQDYFMRSAVRVLLDCMPENIRRHMYIYIESINGGQYMAYMMNRLFPEQKIELRISEAIMLGIAADAPIFINEELFRRQSTPFNRAAHGTTIPTNTLPLPMLEAAMQKAVETENYEFAKALKDEISKRVPPPETLQS